jgi:thiol-disulfide isomerase/thioredoxin
MKKLLVGMMLIVSMVLAASAQTAMDSPKPSEKAGGSMMAASTTMDKGFYDVSKLGPSVSLFTNANDAMMQAKKGTVVLYFAATWCPDCQATYKDLGVNFKMFPMDFHLVVINYDTAKELKMKYGVTQQHTFVEIDASGKALKSWVGSKTVADIIKNAKMM